MKIDWIIQFFLSFFFQYISINVVNQCNMFSNGSTVYGLWCIVCCCCPLKPKKKKNANHFLHNTRTVLRRYWPWVDSCKFMFTINAISKKKSMWIIHAYCIHNYSKFIVRKIHTHHITHCTQLKVPRFEAERVNHQLISIETSKIDKFITHSKTLFRETLTGRAHMFRWKSGFGWDPILNELTWNMCQ